MKRKGFTLIELVMVIVIIGILAAIAIPRFVNLRREASKAACDGNVGALRAAVSGFYARWAISPTSMGANATADGFPTALTNARFLASFLTERALPRCATTGTSAWYTTNYDNTTGVILVHPLGSH